MFQTVKYDLLLYAGDSSLMYQHRNVKVIGQNLNKIFSNVCDWFGINELNIHFGEDKIKRYRLAQRRE